MTLLKLIYSNLEELQKNYDGVDVRPYMIIQMSHKVYNSFWEELRNSKNKEALRFKTAVYSKESLTFDSMRIIVDSSFDTELSTYLNVVQLSQITKLQGLMGIGDRNENNN